MLIHYDIQRTPQLVFLQVTMAERERDLAREEARRAAEACGVQTAEVRRLNELIEGYQRRLGERMS